jgi:hypothetical protein
MAADEREWITQNAYRQPLGVYPVGQTLGQTANFRQTAPEIGVSPGFASSYKSACYTCG